MARPAVSGFSLLNIETAAAEHHPVKSPSTLSGRPVEDGDLTG